MNALINTFYATLYWHLISSVVHNVLMVPDSKVPDSKFHVSNMGPTWVLSAPDEPHVGAMNLAIRGVITGIRFTPLDCEAVHTSAVHFVCCGMPDLKPMLCIILGLSSMYISNIGVSQNIKMINERLDMISCAFGLRIPRRQRACWLVIAVTTDAGFLMTCKNCRECERRQSINYARFQALHHFRIISSRWISV